MVPDTIIGVRHRICLQTDDGHGETSIPPYNFVAGGIIKGGLPMMVSGTMDYGSLYFLTIFTFAVPELLDLI
jgi:hypothetical protein